MAKDHEMVQPALIAHGPESQQGPEGFACPGACKHQQVAAAALKFEPAPQQLDQLLLPLPGLDGGAAELSCVRSREVEADGCDITSREDESF